jgi:hypothetical protein
MLASLNLGDYPLLDFHEQADVVSAEAELPSPEKIVVLPSVQINQNR